MMKNKLQKIGFSFIKRNIHLLERFKLMKKLKKKNDAKYMLKFFIFKQFLVYKNNNQHLIFKSNNNYNTTNQFLG